MSILRKAIDQLLYYYLINELNRKHLITEWAEATAGCRLEVPFFEVWPPWRTKLTHAHARHAPTRVRTKKKKNFPSLIHLPSHSPWMSQFTIHQTAFMELPSMYKVAVPIKSKIHNSCNCCCYYYYLRYALHAPNISK